MLNKVQRITGDKTVFLTSDYSYLNSMFKKEHNTEIERETSGYTGNNQWKIYLKLISEYPVIKITDAPKIKK